MDDEAAIRDLAVRLLGALGYEAEGAADGTDALHRYREAQEAGAPFAAVIADLTVPGGMGGKDLAEHLREFDPAARIVVSSGYANDPILADFSRYGFRGVLVKPYRLGELREALHGALDGDGPDPGTGSPRKREETS